MIRAQNTVIHQDVSKVGFVSENGQAGGEAEYNPMAASMRALIIVVNARAVLVCGW